MLILSLISKVCLKLDGDVYEYGDVVLPPLFHANMCGKIDYK